VGSNKEPVNMGDTTTIPPEIVETEIIEVDRDLGGHVWSHYPTTEIQGSPDVTLYLSEMQLTDLNAPKRNLLKDNGSSYQLSVSKLLGDTESSETRYALEFHNVSQSEYNLNLKFDSYSDCLIRLSDCHEEYDLTQLPTTSAKIRFPSSQFSGLVTVGSSKYYINTEDLSFTFNPSETVTLSSNTYELPASILPSIHLNTIYSDPLEDQIREMKQKTYSVGLYTEHEVCESRKEVCPVEDTVVTFTSEDLLQFVTATLHLKPQSMYPHESIEARYTAREYDHYDLLDVTEQDENTYIISNIDPREEITLNFGGIMEYENNIVRMGPENFEGGTEVCVEPKPKVCKKAVSNRTEDTIVVKQSVEDNETITTIDSGKTERVSTRNDVLNLSVRKAGEWDHLYEESSTLEECVRNPYLEVTEETLRI